MFVIANLLTALARILDLVLNVCVWVLVARAVVSWVNADPYNPIVRFLIAVTEPVLRPIRSRLPLNMGGIDFSPMLVFVAIIFLRSFLVQTLLELAAGLR